MPLHDYDFWTTIGTVAAVIVALAVALTQATVAIILAVRRRKLARRKVASLVSAWIDYEYVPSSTGDYYKRVVSLHLANESDEPVFKVEALCGVETHQGIIQLGPLAAPVIIPVMPPKREFKYDVTMGMLGFGEYAHDSLHQLVASVAFRDHEGKRWEREFDGRLERRKKKRPAVQSKDSDELTVAQAGPVEDAYNPLSIVFFLSNLAGETKVGDKEFHQTLIEHAPGWSDVSRERIAETREILCTSHLAAHVWYPTPRIAYVRLLDEAPEPGKPYGMTILTLVWRNRIGWRLFGLGPFQPWTIPFDAGELETDPLDGREK